jgi:hypothetical protein
LDVSVQKPIAMTLPERDRMIKVAGASTTRRIRHMPRLRAVGHHRLHSEMQLPADRAPREQFALWPLADRKQVLECL